MKKTSFAEKAICVVFGAAVALLGVKYSNKLPDCVEDFINTKIINKK